MKTVTIITIILFLAAAILLGIAGLKFIGIKIFSTNGASEPEEEIPAAEEEPKSEIPEDKEEPEAETDKEEITSIEIYLDGDRQTGIFMGEAVYGMLSQEAFMIYGQDFSDTGFLLAKENEGYEFEPGSIHYIYIYVFIPEYGWNYTRERILIPGDADYAENIELHTDNPQPNEIIAEIDKSNIRISGWSVDFDFSDTTGIDRIEIYLNGPKNFGKFLGDADYGIERPDVANALGNAGYTNSGYSLYFDGSEFEDGSENTLYIYSFSTSGDYSLLIRDFKMEGEVKEPNTITSLVEANLDNRSIEVSGWAVNKNQITEGKPRSLDIEYSSKKIVFVSNRNGNEDIFSMNLDGSELIQLTDYSGNDKYPSISPDGKKIAYTSDIKGIWQIMVMNWDGTDKIQLTRNPWRSGYPAWSFDGSFIYFEVSQEGDWEIYRINSNGSNMKRLTLNPGIPDWHPYGHPFQYKIIYESGTVGNEDLYFMDYNGKNIKKISDADMRKRVPAISADGKIIVFAVYENDNSFIYTMDSNGENLTRISGSLTDCSHPCISPDNAYITFENITGDQEDLYIVNLDGSNLTQLTTTPENDRDPVFMYQIP